MKLITSCYKQAKQITIDQESDSDASDISESGQKQILPKVAPQRTRFKPITPIGRVKNQKKNKVVMKQETINISDSQQIHHEEPSLVMDGEEIDQKVKYRPLRQRLVKAANKCKIERRQFSSTDCSICLTSLESKNDDLIGRLECKHAFCFDCIYESSKFCNKCPYCRTPYQEIRKGFRSIPVQDKQYNDDGYNNEEPCYICGRNDDFDHLLQCQYCEGAFCHTYCDSRLDSDIPPEGSWYCLSCSEIIEHEQNDIIL